MRYFSQQAPHEILHLVTIEDLQLQPVQILDRLKIVASAPRRGYAREWTTHRLFYRFNSLAIRDGASAHCYKQFKVT
jgi:hypothetical protein